MHNVAKGNNPKFIKNYIFGAIGINMFYPVLTFLILFISKLYFRICPLNFMSMEPSLIFVTIWISLFLI
jgi:hypothetical protein